LGADLALLAGLTSANVACGFHAGDPLIMRRVCAAAVERGVTIGAQVSYRDLAGFGRRDMDVAAPELTAEILYQLAALDGIARSEGGRVAYVKPHGALYNRIARDPVQARAVVDAVRAYDPSLPLLTLPGSVVHDVADGLTVVAECFADRAYTAAGTLLSRKEPGAVILDEAAVVERVVKMAVDGTVVAVDGAEVALKARSVCVHGDTPGATALVRAVRAALIEAGGTLEPFARGCCGPATGRCSWRPRTSRRRTGCTPRCGRSRRRASWTSCPGSGRCWWSPTRPPTWTVSPHSFRSCRCPRTPGAARSRWRSPWSTTGRTSTRSPRSPGCPGARWSAGTPPRRTRSPIWASPPASGTCRVWIRRCAWRAASPRARRCRRGRWRSRTGTRRSTRPPPRAAGGCWGAASSGCGTRRATRRRCSGPACASASCPGSPRDRGRAARTAGDRPGPRQTRPRPPGRAVLRRRGRPGLPPGQPARGQPGGGGGRGVHPRRGCAAVPPARVDRGHGSARTAAHQWPRLRDACARPRPGRRAGRVRHAAVRAAQLSRRPWRSRRR